MALSNQNRSLWCWIGCILLFFQISARKTSASFIRLDQTGRNGFAKRHPPHAEIKTNHHDAENFLSRQESFLFGLPNANDWNDELSQLIEDQKRSSLVEALICPGKSNTNYNGDDSSLLQLYLVGRGTLPTTQNQTMSCLFLSTSSPGQATAGPSLVLPLSSASAKSQLKLLSFAYTAKPISKSVCLPLNALLINRDDGLFDQLPWSSWSVDPQLRNRDAAGNIIDSKYHLGKRDAYNRFMGKDWQARSASLGNLALRVKYMLEKNPNNDVKTDDDEDSDLLDTWQEESSKTLAKRLLELQIRELQMELAEIDYELAVARTQSNEMALQNDGDVSQLQIARQKCESQLMQAQESLALYNNEVDQEGLLISALNRMADMSTNNGKNAAPYRGAMGYAPMLDSREDVDGGILPYTSPYDLLKEIIGDQLNADVIGVVLENTNLLDGTLMLGGGIVLQRRTAKKTVSLSGEEITVSDEDEDYGNLDAKGGTTILVECDADEAVGVALACDMPIRIEPQLWERSNMVVEPCPTDEDTDSNNVYESIPKWTIENTDTLFLVEGEGRNASNMTNVSPLRVPTTTSLFDRLFESSTSSSSSPTPSFPTDNPIQSLDELDTMGNQEKARTLMSLSNFQGKLPRPRVLREAKMMGTENPLDKLLLPLIDESVRRQYLIRDAEQRGDDERVKELQSSKSRRQVAMEKAEEAREYGQDDLADRYEEESNVYENLRADVTQDEGSYSRFLDKDEWYERERQARIKRTKKSSFGTLLDGIE